jgi:hypothetical protein
MNFTIETKIELTDARVADALTSAFEGGIGYWACIEDITVPETAIPDPEQKGWLRLTYDQSYPSYIAAPLIGGNVMLSDQEDDLDAEHPRLYVIDRVALERGLNLMASVPKHRHHFYSILDETDDIIVGDVLIQLAVLGEVRYG